MEPCIEGARAELLRLYEFLEPVNAAAAARIARQPVASTQLMVTKLRDFHQVIRADSSGAPVD
ncbi:MAG: hypothetical protein HY525_20845 [Betaproteobacteria bacterium]|nr:hypothetical protein [Betaproteobacteria bacterium]